MQDINSLTLMGRLTKDATLHEGAHTSAANMRVAFTTRARGDDGKWFDDSNFIDAVVFGNIAPTLHPMLTKGTQVVLDGHLVMDEWEDREGNKRTTPKIVARDVRITGPRAAGASQDFSAQGGGRITTDDDIPF